MQIISKGPLILVIDSYLWYAHLVDKSMEVRRSVDRVVVGGGGERTNFMRIKQDKEMLPGLNKSHLHTSALQIAI